MQMICASFVQPACDRVASGYGFPVREEDQVIMAVAYRALDTLVCNLLQRPCRVREYIMSWVGGVDLFTAVGPTIEVFPLSQEMCAADFAGVSMGEPEGTSGPTTPATTPPTSTLLIDTKKMELIDLFPEEDRRFIATLFESPLGSPRYLPWTFLEAIKKMPAKDRGPVVRVCESFLKDEMADQLDVELAMQGVSLVSAEDREFVASLFEPLLADGNSGRLFSILELLKEMPAEDRGSVIRACESFLKDKMVDPVDLDWAMQGVSLVSVEDREFVASLFAPWLADGNRRRLFSVLDLLKETPAEDRGSVIRACEPLLKDEMADQLDLDWAMQGVSLVSVEDREFVAGLFVPLLADRNRWRLFSVLQLLEKTPAEDRGSVIRACELFLKDKMVDPVDLAWVMQGVSLVSVEDREFVTRLFAPWLADGNRRRLFSVL